MLFFIFAIVAISVGYARWLYNNYYWKKQLMKNVPSIPCEHHWLFGGLMSIISLPKVPFTNRPDTNAYWESVAQTFIGQGEGMFKLDIFPLVPYLSRSIVFICDYKIAKDLLIEMFESKEDPEIIIEKKGLRQVTDTVEIENIVDEVLYENQKMVEQYLSGKDKLLGFFVGQSMKKSKGKANPKILNDILKLKLSKKH